jgi:hypothetical protein
MKDPVMQGHVQCWRQHGFSSNQVLLAKNTCSHGQLGRTRNHLHRSLCSNLRREHSGRHILEEKLQIKRKEACLRFRDRSLSLRHCTQPRRVNFVQLWNECSKNATRCGTISKLAEGGLPSANYASFPARDPWISSQEQMANQRSTETAKPQAPYKWASFILGLAVTAAGLLRSHTRVTVVLSLAVVAYALRSKMLWGMLQAVRSPFGGADRLTSDGLSSKRRPDNGREKLGSQKVAAQDGKFGGPRATTERTPIAVESTAVEVVRPTHVAEDGLRPVSPQRCVYLSCLALRRSAERNELRGFELCYVGNHI